MNKETDNPICMKETMQKNMGDCQMKWKPVFVLMTAIFLVTFIAPSLIVLPFSDNERVEGEKREIEQEKEEIQNNHPEEAIEVAVYRTSKQVEEQIPLEEYVIGVVASEMPAEFELEALKAQALAARTYIVKQMKSDEKLGTPDGADVTDTVMHQVYKDKKELKKQWQKDYQWKYEKIKKAVAQTKGEILTYKGSPINATYFSTSNGYTEDAGDYWENDVPYLKSVESPWDIGTPKFNNEMKISVKEFEQKLNVKLPNNNEIGKITARTKGKRVAKVNINGKTFTGKEIRESLGLTSTDFTWKRKGDQITIQTKGNGHGVGMSQYGANGMALEGKTYKEIIKHYYKGVEIRPL